MSRAITIILMAALAALAAGCGSTVTKNAESSHSPGTASPSPSPPPAQSNAGQVGDKFTVTSGAAKYDVTLLSVDQQARPESDYDTPKTGHHLAAAQFRVTAATSTDENSNNNATVVGSDQQAYSSSLSPVAAGTNFASGQIRLQPGSSLVGWVSFELPTGVHVTKVQWTPQAGLSAHSAEWHVRGSAATAPGSTPTAPSSPGTAAPGHTTPPEDTVNAYFDAINRGEYQKAWDLGGKNTTSSYSSFVDGFKNTEMVSVTILDVSGDTGTAVVTARLNTLEKDGSTKVFEGTYTVKNGVIAEFSVHQVS